MYGFDGDFNGEMTFNEPARGYSIRPACNKTWQMKIRILALWRPVKIVVAVVGISHVCHALVGFSMLIFASVIDPRSALIELFFIRSWPADLKSGCISWPINLYLTALIEQSQL
jgi:hypothetical protein